MPLESLLKLAETLKERVGIHGDALSGSETLTRYALIDPLLRELGWDTSDPSAVIPEYSSGSGRADYALMSAGKPAILVEAKKLGTPLRGGVLSQGIANCTVTRFAVTDGARWEIYETNKLGAIDRKPVAEFDLSSDSVTFCRNALALWRPSVETAPPSCTQCDWHRFSDIEYAKGRKPIELKFPDKSRIALNGWFTLLRETTRWLSDKGCLTKAHCPIKLNGRCIVCANPPNANGIWVEVNGLYLHKHIQVKRHFGRAVAIIKHVGKDPSKFRVRFA